MTLTLGSLPDDFKTKVKNEYDVGFESVRYDRERKKDVLKKVIYKDIQKNTVRVNLLHKNIKLEMALNLSDKPVITLVGNKGVLSDPIMRNANEALMYDYEDMDLVDQNRRIIWENGLYGVSVTVIDGFDDDEQQPISNSIHPLSVIPDPDNWTGSKMRFIGFIRRVPKESITESKSYTVPAAFSLEGAKSQSMTDIERAVKNAVGQQYVDDSGLVDVYDHFTTYKGHKYLTTWLGEAGSQCIRIVHLGKMSQNELKKPSRIKYPVQVHRRNPLYMSFYGVSLADEVLQYQDPISLLTNLQLIQARIAALGPDKFISNDLGIDLGDLSKQPIGGRMIPVQTINGGIGQNIFYDQMPNPSQFPYQVVQDLENRAEGNSASSIAFGQTQPGTQTKGEVQELMKNMNALLGEISNNYLRGQKDYYGAHYEAYDEYMSPRKSKNIALKSKGSSRSLSLKKKEFVAGGKFRVYVESTEEIRKKNDQNFAKLQSLAGLVLQNMKPGYGMNQFLRKMIDLLSIDELNPTIYIPESVDEMKAKMNLELLNNDIAIEPLAEGEDPLTHLEIYKQGLPTKARDEAIDDCVKKYTALPPELPTGDTGQSDPTTSAMAMNMVNSSLTDSITQ